MPQQTEFSMIIGGSSGIGLACAQQLNRPGQSIILVGRNQAKLSQAADSLNQVDQVLCWPCDLYDHEQVDSLAQNILQFKQPIKQLVNAAGYFNPTAFIDHSRDDYDRYLDINKATFFITQAVAVNMKYHQFGRVVNIGSMWAHQAIKAPPLLLTQWQKRPCMRSLST